MKKWFTITTFTRYILGQASVYGRLDKSYIQSLLKGLCLSHPLLLSFFHMASSVQAVLLIVGCSCNDFICKLKEYKESLYIFLWIIHLLSLYYLVKTNISHSSNKTSYKCFVLVTVKFVGLVWFRCIWQTWTGEMW